MEGAGELEVRSQNCACYCILDQLQVFSQAIGPQWQAHIVTKNRELSGQNMPASSPQAD
jgi:hypothetical protein